jgi:hypothetical protein
MGIRFLIDSDKFYFVDGDDGITESIVPFTAHEHYTHSHYHGVERPMSPEIQIRKIIDVSKERVLLSFNFDKLPTGHFCMSDTTAIKPDSALIKYLIRHKFDVPKELLEINREIVL